MATMVVAFQLRTAMAAADIMIKAITVSRAIIRNASITTIIMRHGHIIAKAIIAQPITGIPTTGNPIIGTHTTADLIIARNAIATIMGRVGIMACVRTMGADTNTGAIAVIGKVHA
jgi:hypothetical protein